MDGFGVADWHHAEGDVLGAHVVRALDLVDLIRLSHHDRMMLQHDRVCVDSGRTLGVAVLSGHGQVQSEGIRIYDINVAGLGSSQGINTTVEGLVGADLDSDSSVLAVNSNWRGRCKFTGLIKLWINVRIH